MANEVQVFEMIGDRAGSEARPITFRAKQTLTIGGAASASFDPSTQSITIISTTNCLVEFGTAPDGLGVTWPIVAGQIYDFAAKYLQKVIAVAGTATAPAVTITSDSTEYTEDAASVANPVGPMIMLRRRDTPVTNEVSAESDVIAWNATSKGEAYVRNLALEALIPVSLGPKLSAASLSITWASDQVLPAGTNLIGKVGIDQTTPGTTNLVAAGGNVASGATDSGNPVKIGLRYNSAGVTVTTGQRVDAQGDANGNLIVRLFGARPGGVDGVSNSSIVTVTGADSAPTDATLRPLAVAGSVFNGSTWDRMAGDTRGIYTRDGGYSFSHISTSTTTTVKSGAGVLHTVTVNNLGTVASTTTIYDNTAGSGTVIAIINTLAGQESYTYDVAFATGLTIVTTGTVAPDITVSYR